MPRVRTGAMRTRTRVPTVISRRSSPMAENSNWPPSAMRARGVASLERFSRVPQTTSTEFRRKPMSRLTNAALMPRATKPSRMLQISGFFATPRPIFFA